MAVNIKTTGLWFRFKNFLIKDIYFIHFRLFNLYYLIELPVNQGHLPPPTIAVMPRIILLASAIFASVLAISC